MTRRRTWTLYGVRHRQCTEEASEMLPLATCTSLPPPTALGYTGLALWRVTMRRLGKRASLPPAKVNALAMLALENDDGLGSSPRKTPLPLDLGIIRAEGYTEGVSGHLAGSTADC